MGAAAVLAQESLAVEPGGQVVTRLRVRNTGEVVDQFTFEPLGPAAQWASFEPQSLSLFPDGEGVTEVRFAPPRQPSTRAGTVPFGIRVAAQEDPAGSVVAEGELSVSRYGELLAELVPRTARGRATGHQELTVQNRGNTPLRARLVGVDPDRRVRFGFNPPEALARPGAAAVTKVEVVPRRRFLRGPAVTHPYLVRVEPTEQPPVEVAGAFLQEALIPRWAPRALLALVGLAAAWLLFLRPTVESTAQDAAEDQVDESSQVAASQAVAPALAAADERLAKVEQAVGLEPGAPLPGATTTTRPGVLALGDPVDDRLVATDTTPDVYRVADDRILSVTDLVFENPAGHLGTVALLRGEQVLLELRLDNFRDLDYHFVAPLVFPPGSELRFRVECANPGTPQPPCTPALTFLGLLRPAPPP